MKKWTKTEKFLAFCLACGAVVMYLRAFFGTEITDEAYYISDALAMLQGNLPLAYNNYSYGTCSAFLLIPQLFVYDLLVPSHAGLFLFTRLSFATFRLVVLLLSCRILSKSIKRSHAMLLVAMLMPYSVVGIHNYSYNTIPVFLTLLIGILLHDTLECGGGRAKGKMYLCGFLSGIAVFSHVGYGIAVIVFLLLILCRGSKGKRGAYAVAFLAGGMTEILLVLVPIALQTGVAALWRGIDLKIFHPFPKMSKTRLTDFEKLLDLLRMSKPMVLLAVTSGTAFCLLTGLFLRGKKCDGKLWKVLRFSFAAGLTLVLLWLVTRLPISLNGVEEVYYLGLLAAWCVGFLLLLPHLWKHSPLFAYLAIYPVVYSAAAVFVIDSNEAVSRFSAAVPALLPIVLILLQADGRWTRRLGASCAVIVTFLLLYNSAAYVYRDEPVFRLNTRVESGVYQGIYTTPERARDLPELEEYLNAAVEEGEYYAFRDNVPSGYLMMHTGIMCDMATWDVMQYSYNCNMPARLYDYYMRRGAIPDKIIYVDFGRDEQLSVEDESFRYNDFLSAYYALEDEVALNGTFCRVLVYRNNGTFDGDYIYWIDTYRQLP